MSIHADLEWSPPVETGLSGDADPNATPNVQMNEFADTIDEFHQPGVYVLRLSTPNSNSTELHHRLWLQDHDSVDSCLDQIIEATGGIFYVGEAHDVLSRIEEHIDHPNRSTTIATTYPIHHIHDVDFCDSKSEAEEREMNKAREIAEEHPTAYVHHR
jgi:predicted GIY-YIG superfamily endonuclease